MARRTLKPRVTREMQQESDTLALMQDERFHRFLFTILSECGMFSGSFHSEDGVLHFGEGRRSLGLDILSTVAEVVGGKERALALILQAEMKTQEEVTHDNRDYDDRSNDLDD